MELLKIVHRYHYSVSKKRFVKQVFQNQYDKDTGANLGISVISCDCIQDSPASTCVHLRQYYPELLSTPPLYWKFKQSDLPASCSLRQETILSGDDCHYNIDDLPDDDAKEFFNRMKNVLKIYRCDEAISLIATPEEIYTIMDTQPNPR